MNVPHYPIRAAENGFTYRFISTGPKGEVEKIVVFTAWEEPGIYNLGFGDWRTESEEIDDLSVTGNDDTDKVLATVAAITYDFMAERPGAVVFAIGSTVARTRLYQMAIGKNILWLRESLRIFGLRAGPCDAFATGNTYEAFYVIRTA